jgi:hypothetical protein
MSRRAHTYYKWNKHNNRMFHLRFLLLASCCFNYVCLRGLDADHVWIGPHTNQKDWVDTFDICLMRDITNVCPSMPARYKILMTDSAKPVLGKWIFPRWEIKWRIKCPLQF